jgi:hypothetical protein
MRIAKPLLLVSTPVGMVWGLFEGWRMAGGLVFLMALMMGIVTAGIISVVRVVRAEAAQQAAGRRAGLPDPKH